MCEDRGSLRPADCWIVANRIDQLPEFFCKEAARRTLLPVSFPTLQRNYLPSRVRAPYCLHSPRRGQCPGFGCPSALIGRSFPWGGSPCLESMAIRWRVWADVPRSLTDIARLTVALLQKAWIFSCPPYLANSPHFLQVRVWPSFWSKKLQENELCKKVMQRQYQNYRDLIVSEDGSSRFRFERNMHF